MHVCIWTLTLRLLKYFMGFWTKKVAPSIIPRLHFKGVLRVGLQTDHPLVGEGSSPLGYRLAGPVTPGPHAVLEDEALDERTAREVGFPF